MQQRNNQRERKKDSPCPSLLLPACFSVQKRKRKARTEREKNREQRDKEEKVTYLQRESESSSKGEREGEEMQGNITVEVKEEKSLVIPLFFFFKNFFSVLTPLSLCLYTVKKLGGLSFWSGFRSLLELGHKISWFCALLYSFP